MLWFHYLKEYGYAFQEEPAAELATSSYSDTHTPVTVATARAKDVTPRTRKIKRERAEIEQVSTVESEGATRTVKQEKLEAEVASARSERGKTASGSLVKAIKTEAVDTPVVKDKHGTCVEVERTTDTENHKQNHTPKAIQISSTNSNSEHYCLFIHYTCAYMYHHIYTCIYTCTLHPLYSFSMCFRHSQKEQAQTASHSIKTSQETKCLIQARGC